MKRFLFAIALVLSAPTHAHAEISANLMAAYANNGAFHAALGFFRNGQRAQGCTALRHAIRIGEAYRLDLSSDRRLFNQHCLTQF